MHKARGLALVGACALLVSGAYWALGHAGQDAHPDFAGNWVTDVSQSTFSGRLPYRSGTLLFALDGNRLKAVADVVTANGRAFHFEYEGPVDGTKVAVIGNPYYDGAASRWLDARTLERTEFRGAEITGSTTFRLSTDKQVLIAESDRQTPENRSQYLSKITWRREQDPLLTQSVAPPDRSQIELCEVCHGPSGNSQTAEWPSIAGQTAQYLTVQLKLLRSGYRYDSSMSPMAAELDDAAILSIAKYFADKESVDVTPQNAPDPAAVRLFAVGDASRQLRACADCHGARGEGNRQDGTPAIHRQQKAYTVKQLKAYADGSRYDASKSGGELLNANAAEMFDIAKRLTAEEYEALASLLEGQPPETPL